MLSEVDESSRDEEYEDFVMQMKIAMEPRRDSRNGDECESIWVVDDERSSQT